MTIVRRPASAVCSAVAAATVVLPTPPLPVNSRVRTGAGSLAAVTASVIAGRAPDGGLDEHLQVGEGGLEDAGLGAPLDEAGDGEHEVDGQLVDDLGGRAVVFGG